MKKFTFFIVSCCLLLCTSCKKDDFTTNSYNATFEYHIANAENANSLKHLLDNQDDIWQKEITLTLLNTSTTDAEAKTKFEASIIVIDVKQDSWKAFLEEGDYFTYSLNRTTIGKQAVLRTVKFDKDGHIVL